MELKHILRHREINNALSRSFLLLHFRHFMYNFTSFGIVYSFAYVDISTLYGLWDDLFFRFILFLFRFVHFLFLFLLPAKKTSIKLLPHAMSTHSGLFSSSSFLLIKMEWKTNGRMKENVNRKFTHFKCYLVSSFHYIIYIYASRKSFECRNCCSFRFMCSSRFVYLQWNLLYW